MQKKCSACGDTVVISLQKLVYQSVEISNVPVACCQSCSHNSVMDENVKSDLKRLIYSIGKTSEKKSYQFEEYSSLVQLELSLNKSAALSFYQ